MASRADLEPVAFLRVEDGDDLIVSFAITQAEAYDVASLTLLRTPKYEHFLADYDRGVDVSHERFPEHDDDRLRRIGLADGVVEIETAHTRYALDVSRVEREELRNARRVLKQMNFDGRFALELD